MKALRGSEGLRSEPEAFEGMRSDMEQFIGCDAHKPYSVFVGMNERGEYTRAGAGQP